MERYNKIRSLIKDGDIVLFSNSGILPSLIKYFDGANYTHAGVVYWSFDRLMIIDSNAKGVRPDFLSMRIRKCNNFIILRPLAVANRIDFSLKQVMKSADIGIKYDFLMLPRIAISRKFGINLKFLGRNNRDICSEFVRRYTNLVGIKCYSEANKGIENWITPQDFIRYLNINEIEPINI